MMLWKKILSICVSVTLLGTLIPAMASAEESVSKGLVTTQDSSVDVSFEEIERIVNEQSISLNELQMQSTPMNPYDNTVISSETMNQLQIQQRGLKKTAVVYALKYGGSALSKIVGLLSDKNAALLKKHSYELGDALDRFSDSIEARLVDFMIHELGFPPSSARSIAWAICLVAL